MTDKKWKTYEEVAVHLLNEFSHEFGLEEIKGKTKVPGRKSGTTWEIEGIGFKDKGDGFVIVECKRWTTTKQSQEIVGALAYRIRDCGADGGIIVSPLGLQSGGEKVANNENVTSVLLTPESTTKEYILSFLNKVMIGRVDEIHIGLTESIRVRKFENGKLIEDSGA